MNRRDLYEALAIANAAVTVAEVVLGHLAPADATAWLLVSVVLAILA